MNCMPMDSITEVFYRVNIMLLATKHIVDNNLVFQYSVRQRTGTSCKQHSPNLSTSLFWPMTPRAQMWLVNSTDYKI